MDRLDTVYTFNRTWRPAGYWGLTFNVVLGFPAMFVIPVLAPDVSIELAADVYPILLATWAAAAAVRQWGKNKGSET